MKKKNNSINPDLHFRVLHFLEENPVLTQRELAKKLGVSLGGVNYCLNALVQLGHLKINNFQKNSNKSAYLYLLTPAGLSNKAILATSFLKRKMDEYKALKMEIDMVKSKIKCSNLMNGGSR
ncbi:MarR family EPS-associated transcriptional regulator [Candidatus Methylopumilus rimovensis]|uniref:MarR family EPS-associated transcriptional regulator n=1 Tax=Candidatus Methylopumilus rimovensis TaxID=2588535 RepID=A0AAE6FSZ1_9PROT|nr:MarR family EPS-associated transcriptional regulator [Candidatus Methylopumilus rimovensis]QDD13357.1 MarR family EPS-associated transcriptional regulator [Candidatus Methylopumilus rimovensis]